MRGRRLFHRIVLHGFFLLVLEALAVLVVVVLYGRTPQWHTFTEGLATHLTNDQFAEGADPARMQREVDSLRRSLELEISLYSADGALLASNVSPALAAIPRAELVAQQGRPAYRYGRPPRIIAPAVIGGTLVGYSVSQLPRGEPDVLRSVLIAVAVLFVLSAASIPVARSIASPLERLTRAARAIGAGDLSARADIRCSRVREVGELAEAFDDMAVRLETLVRNEKELLANVSHELRTPMARIRIALELAAEGDLDQSRRLLSEIGLDLGELEKLVEDVLATARMDLASGKASAGPPLRKEPIEVAALLDRAALRFRTAHPERELEMKVAEQLPEIDADEGMLRRVVENLLDNARKYSDTGPIELRAHEHAGRLVVEIEDHGIGIDPEDQKRLFTPFFRTDRSRSRGTGGVGLGLALSRRIVEAHGGKVEIESAPGQGTTVRFGLPVA